MKRVTVVLIMLLGAMMSACSAPPNDESSIAAEIEVASVTKNKVVDQKKGTYYEFVIELVLARRGVNGLESKIAKGSVKVLSRQSQPLQASAKDDHLSVDLACKDAECNQFSILVTATPKAQVPQASPGSQDVRLIQTQLAVLFVDGADGIKEADRRRGEGDLTSAAALL